MAGAADVNLGTLMGGVTEYEPVSVINRGAFGLVILCKEVDTGDAVAVKLIERGAKITEYVQREIINHLHLRHPHVIGLRTVFLTPTHLGIVMEHAAGGDLFQLVTRARAAAPGRRGGLPEVDARWYFQQLVCALEYCHAMGVASRDVKLENTLLDGDADRPLIKLCDFGYSKHDRFQSAPDSRVGTPAYLAPEVILSSEDRPYDAKAADVWSAGVVLFILLSASYPFGRPEDDALPADQRLHAMLQRILAADWPRVALAGDHVGGGVGLGTAEGGGGADGAVDPAAPSATPGTASPACIDLLGRMLTADPAARATLAEVAAHPWFTRDLPPGVADLNARLVAEQTGADALAARKAAVEESMLVLAEAAVAPARGGWSGDEEGGLGDASGSGALPGDDGA